MEKKKKICIYILMVVIALVSVASTYLLMTYVFNKDEKKENSVIEYSVNDELIQDLYSFVAIKEDAPSLWYDSLWYEALELTVPEMTTLTSDLDPFIKNELGYRFMPVEALLKVECTDEIEDLIVGTNENGLACGDYITFDDNNKLIYTSYTTKVNESDLKESVEKIFGPDSYTARGFGTYYSEYMYDEDEKAYFYFEGIGSKLGESMLTSLESVTSGEDTITLNIRLYQEASETQDAAEHGIYKLLYKLSNGNYYLYSIEKAV